MRHVQDFLRPVALFLLPVAVVCLVFLQYGSSFRAMEFGPSLRERVDRSFDLALTRPYQCLALGNSRMYRGLNPSELSVPTFNFAQDDDTFNHYYYKLRYVEQGGVRPRCLILGVDYFEFSFLSTLRKEFYSRHLDHEFSTDYPSPSGRMFGVDWDRIFHPAANDAFNEFMTVRFSQPLIAVVKYAIARLRGQELQPQYIYKDNGQYVASMDIESAFLSRFVRRDTARLPVAEQYFDRVLADAREHGITVVLVMLPMVRQEWNTYQPGVVEEFERYFREKAQAPSVYYVNYGRHPAFAIGDFADRHHLNRRGADKFSRLLDQDLSRILSTAPAP